ncbi:MAG: hypothetical protein J6A23_10855, partial [Thermoguttaceae bacterium]|nr:hypothetical protein [Thermoguttaceae bacterium]
MADTVRSLEEIRSYSERYEIENDSPFISPDDFYFRPQPLRFVDEAQGLRNLAKWGGSAPGLHSVSGQTGAEPMTSEEKFFAGVPSASNTDTVKYRGHEYRRSWGGYDGGVEASIDGEWKGDTFDALCLRLDRAKRAADDGDLEGALLDIGPFLWFVRPAGASSGYWKYKYVLESHGVKLYIHSNPKGTIPPVRVRFGFECLARTDLFEAVDTLKKCLSDVGFSWEREVLSRVDMQVMLPVDIYEFVQAMQGARVVTQCRGKCEMVSDCRTLRIQTLTFRSRSMELCIYDKKAHFLDSDAVYYMTFYRWILGGEVPENLTRIEFRFRRAMLDRYGIRSFDDLRRSQGALPQLVGQEWFRILDRDKVRGSEREIKNAKIWDETLQAFQFYFGREITSSKRSVDSLKEFRSEKKPPQAERVLKQAVGCLASYAALTMPPSDDEDDVVGYCSDVLSAFSHVCTEKV